MCNSSWEMTAFDLCLKPDISMDLVLALTSADAQTYDDYGNMTVAVLSVCSVPERNDGGMRINAHMASLLHFAASIHQGSKTDVGVGEAWSHPQKHTADIVQIDIVAC